MCQCSGGSFVYKIKKQSYKSNGVNPQKELKIFQQGLVCIELFNKIKSIKA